MAVRTIGGTPETLSAQDLTACVHEIFAANREEMMDQDVNARLRRMGVNCSYVERTCALNELVASGFLSRHVAYSYSGAPSVLFQHVPVPLVRAEDLSLCHGLPGRD